MKTKKYRFIIEQVLFILFINYLVLFYEGFIYKTHWKSTFIFAMAFFHMGTFGSLYATIISKPLSSEKKEVLFNFNFFIYTGFISLMIYHNCQITSNNLASQYCFGLYMLIFVVAFLVETYRAYKKYKSPVMIESLINIKKVDN